MRDRGERLALVVTAAGRGVRFESNRPKQYVPLLGIPVLQRTLAALDVCPLVDALMVVVNSAEVDYCRSEIAGEQIEKVVGVVEGAEHRALSVRNGLSALAQIGSWDYVGVHDGARPLITCDEVERAVQTLVTEPEVEGVVLAVPSVDTMKEVDDQGRITGTADRDRLWRAQTPQIFRWRTLMSAYDQPEEVLVAATDDSALVEASGATVKVVQGSPENLKITDRSDFRHAENILAERRL